MNFAVIKTGGKQYQVASGDMLTIEKLPEAIGEKVVFKEVLLTDDGKQTTIGTPTVSGATVAAEVMATGKAKKVTVIKYKSKTRYRVKRGHRQLYTKVRIATIDSGAHS